MSDAVDATGEAGGAGKPAADRVLRAKYLDWCSARVADRLFKLRPEEIYELARTLDADGTDDIEPTADFRAVVGRLTEELTRELRLPAFPEWQRLYAAAPEQFDEEMVGFWREISD